MLIWIKIVIMTRPKYCRRVGCIPGVKLFIPDGVPASECDEIVLSFDEFEALRLADLEGLYQEQCAGMMNVSRQTFGRIIESAHRKIAEALIHGRGLKISGGTVSYEEMGKIQCNCEFSINRCNNENGCPDCPGCRKLNKKKGANHENSTANKR